MKAIGYIRVSTADQGNSLEVQTRKIQDYCNFRGITLEHIYTDEDVSGGKPFYSRAGGAEANNALINSDIKTIVCVKPDRLFRSVKDALITVDDWSNNKISLHIIDLGGNSIDTQTALGRMFFIQSISMAEFERNITGERTKSVLNHRKDTGKSYCAAILGFDNVDGERMVNFSEMETVKKIFNLHYTGYSMNNIAEALNKYGIKPKNHGKIYKRKDGTEYTKESTFHASTIKSILDNPIYQQYL